MTWTPLVPVCLYAFANHSFIGLQAEMSFSVLVRVWYQSCCCCIYRTLNLSWSYMWTPSLRAETSHSSVPSLRARCIILSVYHTDCRGSVYPFLRVLHMYNACPDPFLFMRLTSGHHATHHLGTSACRPCSLAVLVNAIFYARTSLLHSHLHACANTVCSYEPPDSTPHCPMQLFTHLFCLAIIQLHVLNSSLHVCSD